ncbi:MAG: HAMP domain-containing histidine kinase [Spirochaetaceae bacterium]|nr:HAMP domain-containing histidine kinase [Spirochaetaceae bacterium]
MKVIKRLQRKMVVTVLVIQAIVFALVLISLNLMVSFSVLREMKGSLYHFVRHNIPILEKRHDWVQSRMKDIPLTESQVPLRNQNTPPNDENAWRNFFANVMPFANETLAKNFFGITYDMEGKLASILDTFPRYTDEEMNELINLGLDLEFTEKPKMFFSSMGSFLYIKKNTNQGSLVALADFTREMKTAGRMMLVSVGIYLLSIMISAAVAWFVAKRSVRPVQEAFETQKQFIADAGHELKTPISVVAANADALSGEIGDNKWLNYIKSETNRMARLINDLLYLAKNDAGRMPLVYSSVDVSRVVEAAVLPFESIVYEQDKELELEIQEGVQWVCDGGGISQIVVILLDNAIKNSSAGAKIKVSLAMEGNRRGNRSQGKFGKSHSHPVITVYNQGEGLSEDEIKQIFKRFYRSDSSRTRTTGGCGLGLSIAQAIAQAHQGSIVVEGCQGEWISFSLHLGLVRQKIPVIEE